MCRRARFRRLAAPPGGARRVVSDLKGLMPRIEPATAVAISQRKNSWPRSYVSASSISTTGCPAWRSASSCFRSEGINAKDRTGYSCGNLPTEELLAKVVCVGELDFDDWLPRLAERVELFPI